MLNADIVLALLQWTLIGVGGSICVLTFATLMFPSEMGGYVYTYPDGREVQAAYTGEFDGFSAWASTMMAFGIGLLTIAAGAVLFCLRRIGNYMGDMHDELRQTNNKEAG